MTAITTENTVNGTAETAVLLLLEEVSTHFLKHAPPHADVRTPVPKRTRRGRKEAERKGKGTEGCVHVSHGAHSHHAFSAAF